jgi:hypothetical protein
MAKTQISSNDLMTNAIIQPYFQVGMITSSQNITGGTDSLIAFNDETYDSHSFYNISTNIFTPLISGFYLFATSIMWIGITTGKDAYVYLSKNGTGIQTVQITSAITNSYTTLTGTFVAKMNGTTDYISLYASHNDGTSVHQIYGNKIYTYFTGLKVSS